LCAFKHRNKIVEALRVCRGNKTLFRTRWAGRELPPDSDNRSSGKDAIYLFSGVITIYKDDNYCKWHDTMEFES